MLPILLNFSNKSPSFQNIGHRARGARLRLASFCAATLGCWIGTATAADPPAPPSQTLEEVTVTATKRTESAQNVPLSITTFSQKELEQKSITDFFDYGT